MCILLNIVENVFFHYTRELKNCIIYNKVYGKEMGALRSFFHCRTEKYRYRSRAAIICIGAFCTEIALISFFVMFFNIFGAPDREIILQMLILAAISIFSGLSLCLIIYEGARTIIRRKSRYTYLDIQLKAVVFSRYSKAFRVLGRKRIYRELFVIPFKELSYIGLYRDEKRIQLKGKIRCYCLDSDNLGYHVRGGDIEMDRWWLNSGGFTETDSLLIDESFGKAEKIVSVLNAAKKRFDELPPPKAYEFKEAEIVKRRKMMKRTLPDSFDFSRSWK